MAISIPKCLRLFWRLICLSSLCVVLVWRSSNYLSYPTLNQSYFHTPYKFRIPSVSLCFSLQSLLGGGTQYYFDTSENVSFSDRSMKQHFEETPQVNNTLISCGYRDQHSFSLVVKNASQCSSDSFRVKKYRMHGYMCYRYKLQGSAQSTLIGNAFALDHPGALYQLSLSDAFAGGHKMCPMIHHSELPLDDRNLNQEILPSHIQQETFELSYSSINVSRLKPPYDTNCMDHSRSSCTLLCTENLLAQYGIASSSAISFEDEFDFIQPESNNTQDNKNPMKVMQEAGDRCARSCYRPSCHDEVTRTYVSRPLEEKLNGKLNFVIKNIAHPMLVMKFIEKLTLTDILTEAANLSAIFVSFSLLGSLVVITDCEKKNHILSSLNVTVRKVRILVHSRSRVIKKIIASCSQNEDHQFHRKTHLARVARWVKNSFIALCLLYQFIELSVPFFQYRVSLILSFEFNPIISPYPELIACTRASSLISQREYVMPDQSNYEKLGRQEAEAQNFTLGQLMKETPQLNEILQGCRIRPPENQYPALHYFSGEECRKFFKITKFLWSRSICYKFTVDYTPCNRLSIHEPHFTQQLLKALVAYPGLLYSVILGPKFHHRRQIYLSLNPGGVEFTTNALYVTIFREGEMKTLALLSNHVINETLLPAPYQTNCNIPQYAITRCLNDCLLHQTEHFHRLPRGGLWNDSIVNSHLKLQTYLDDSNGYFYHEIMRSFPICSDRCKPCERMQSITFVRQMNNSRERLELTVDSYAEAIWYIKAVPKTSFFRYLFNLLCCLNFWLGLSLIELDISSHFTQRKHIHTLFKKRYLAVNHLTKRLLQFVQLTGGGKNVFFTRLRKFFDKRVLLGFLISPICFWHLYYEVESYSAYPTIMHSFTQVEEAYDNSTELSICLDVQEILSSKYNSTTETFSLHKVTLAQMFAASPRVDSLVTACGFHGLDGSSSSGNVTDQLFFYERDASLCHKIFSNKRYLYKGFICYQFNKQPRKEMKYSRFMTRVLASKMIAFNSSSLTHRIMLLAVPSGEYPWIGGVWSLRIRPTSGFQWYSISHRKYIHNKLPWHYSQIDVGHVTYPRCYPECIERKLKHFKLVYYSIHPEGEYGSSDSSYLTQQDRADRKIGNQYTRARAICRKCASVHVNLVSEKYSYLTTELVAMGREKRYEIYGSQTFYLAHSENPVMIVTFVPAYSLLQLMITLGSIVAIWFGLSIKTIIDSTQIEGNPVTLTQLKRLNCQLDEAIDALDEINGLFSGRKRKLNATTCRYRGNVSQSTPCTRL